MLHLRVPWWAHPAWALVALTGGTGLVAVLLPDATYQEQWHTSKYLDANMTQVLALLFTVCLLALVIAALPTTGARATTITFTTRQLAYLRSAGRILLALSLMGYALWVGIAVLNGVGFGDLEAVLERSSGAIGGLKSMARPVAGLTTLTQCGPLAVAVGAILRRLGEGGRWYWSLFPLAAVRTLFYAERLALMEVAIPALIIAAVTVAPNRRGTTRMFTQVAPVLAGPAVWLLFAVSEYMRSWIYYQQGASQPFLAWVSVRFVGYYATAFNNSAMYAANFPTGQAAPVYVLAFLFNAPLIDTIVSPGLIDGMTPSDWWWDIRDRFGNVEFNNSGSFLCSFGELGIAGALVYWVVFGAVFGRIYNGLRHGSLPALLGHSCLFVAILELPRFIYVAEGRSFPVVVALIIISLTYPHIVPAWRRIASAPLRPNGQSRWPLGPSASGHVRTPPDPRPTQMPGTAGKNTAPAVAAQVLVVIPTLGTREAIADVLYGLTRQTLAPAEIVVALQGDPAVVRKAARWFPDLPVTIIDSPTGAARARNRGIRAATSDWNIVTFPDDDVWHATTALENAATALRPGGVVVGSVRSVEGRSRWRIATRPKPLTRRTVWTHAMEAGMFITREAWNRVGEFDETLGVGADTSWQSGEGTDWLLRALRAGVPAAHHPEIVLFENTAEPADPVAAIQRATRYARGTGRVCQAHYHWPAQAGLLARGTARLLLAVLSGSRQNISMAAGVLRGRWEGLTSRPGPTPETSQDHG